MRLLYWNFSIFLQLLLDFLVKITAAIAIRFINLSFWGSDCIENDLEFLSPVNPGSLAWLTKMQTTRFSETFWTNWPQLEIQSSKAKMIEANFEVYWRKSTKSQFFDRNFESKLTENWTFTKLPQSL